MNITKIISKIICVILGTVICLGIMSCGNDGTSVGNKGLPAELVSEPKSVEDVLQEGMEEADKKEPVVTVENENVPDPSMEREEEKKIETDDAAERSAERVDVDLTAMSSTMVYSEVYDMVYYPEKYIGKTIKMDGLFASYHDEETGKNYYACIIQDATACCSQGIEFDPGDRYTYPGDYPGEGEVVTVVGVFDTYMEGENKFCTLRNAEMI